jgi:hypothetical protein
MFVEITQDECSADHNPACGRRSDYDLREQLLWHARTQLTVLLTPPTVLTPAQGPHGMNLFILFVEGEIRNGNQYQNHLRVRIFCDGK